MANGKYCSAINCSNHEKNKAFSFHQFPKDEIIRNQWIIATKRKDFNPSDRAVLCSKHFATDAFEFGGIRKRLKKNAIPTIFDLSPHVQAPKAKMKRVLFRSQENSWPDSDLGMCDSMSDGSTSYTAPVYTPGSNAELSSKENANFLSAINGTRSCFESEDNGLPSGRVILKEELKIKQEEEEIVDNQTSEDELTLSGKSGNQNVQGSSLSGHNPKSGSPEPFCAVFLKEEPSEVDQANLLYEEEVYGTSGTGIWKPACDSSVTSHSQAAAPSEMLLVDGLRVRNPNEPSVEDNRDEGEKTAANQFHKVEEIKSEENLKRNSTVFYTGDGYFYIVRSKRNEHGHMRCAVFRSCPGRGAMPLDPSRRIWESLRMTRPHNHPPDANWIVVMKVRRRILERSYAEGTAFSQIIQEETDGLDPEVAANPELLLKTLVKPMNRKRKCKFDEENFTPADLAQLGMFLETSPRFGDSADNRPFYRATVLDADDVGVVFISETLTEVLPECSHIQVDTTYRVVPTSPPCHHLLILAPVHRNLLVLPTVFVLMSNRTESLYQLVFTFVKQTLTQWRLRVITADYDHVLQSALRRVWTRAAVVGNWCHSATCMDLKANQLGLSELLWTDKNANQVFKKCQALPFLPPEQVQEGYEHVIKSAKTETLQALQVFLDYVRSVWLKGVGVKTFSVFRQQQRTFTDIEFFHRKMREHFRRLPLTIWNFTDAIRNCEHDAVTSLNTLSKRLRSKNDRPKPILLHKYMASLTSDLVQEVMGVGDFLDAVGLRIEHFHNHGYTVVSYAGAEEGGLEGLEASWLPPDSWDPGSRKNKRRHIKRPLEQRADSGEEAVCKRPTEESSAPPELVESV